MMTRLGKLLVFVNLAVSVGLMAWALSLYTNRVNWLDATTAEGKVEGQITTLKKEIDRLTKAIAETQQGYAGRRYALAATEERLDTRDRVFKQRLEQARNGRFKVQLTTDKGAFGEGVMYDVTREGGDILGPDDKPLRGLKTLQDEFAAEVRAIEQLQVGQGRLPEAQWMDIAGGNVPLPQVAELTPKLGIGDLRKLHGVLSDLIKRDESAVNRQVALETSLGGESDYLADKSVGAMIDLQTLQRRERQLQKRLRDATGAAPAPDPGL
jgi:hypothetical protein